MMKKPLEKLFHFLKNLLFKSKREDILIDESTRKLLLENGWDLSNCVKIKDLTGKNYYIVDGNQEMETDD